MINRSLAKSMHTWRRPLLIAVAAVAGTCTLIPVQAQPATPPTPPPAAPQSAPAPQERVAAIKGSFAQSQAALRKYEWVETTVVSLKGEEKSTKQNRCYYGAEGKLQKVLVSTTPEEKPGRGLRGKIKENKKEELTEYMEEAAALVHKYLPPESERIQACVQAGKAFIQVLEPGKRARIEFKDYLQPGDAFSVEIDLTNNTILGLTVASSLSKEKDPVTLTVQFGKFPDGTIYTAETKLDAKAKNVTVMVTNSGYRKTGA